LKEELIGRGSGVVRSYALYGGTTGETDEFSLPLRAGWAAGYQFDVEKGVVFGRFGHIGEHGEAAREPMVSRARKECCQIRCDHWFGSRRTKWQAAHVWLRPSSAA
jgi:hypothetical protein